MVGGEPGRVPSPNSISRSNTPGLLSGTNPNIAPQHLFDTASLNSEAFPSPSLPAYALRQHSPGTNLEAPQSYDALQSQNTQLRTRVNELEVINDLFRGRVTELEQTEQEARRAERMKDEETERVKADLVTANAKVADLQRRLDELSNQNTPSRKRTRRATAEEGVE
ncbi:GATA zinc finger protein 3 [Vermiconidia calcicola]|uniref:GATA zinc finger protein 3 n=1 Tax=Vermiconidia calcicola TaxID=1690605 RepID=A0ACC3MGE8_9PEZI|nr:GATA zinc finger protein 3 [Vermiconidia calcicola]